jgi:hypothetical protein
MKARRVVAGVGVAGAMLVGSALSASANIAWCIEDPPVQVQTPTGTYLVVNTSVSVPTHDAKYLAEVVVDAVTSADGAGGTLITVYVSVPATINVARVTASVQKFQVYSASTTVTGGSSATIVLDVPAA